jgi:hypothetical protein
MYKSFPQYEMPLMTTFLLGQKYSKTRGGRKEMEWERGKEGDMKGKGQDRWKGEGRWGEGYTQG